MEATRLISWTGSRRTPSVPRDVAVDVWRPSRKSQCDKKLSRGGTAFVTAYYQAFDSCASGDERGAKISQFYHPDALLIFEDDQKQGKDAICEKIRNLPFQQVQHVITKTDCQPTLDGGVLIMVLGQLQADQDKPLGFSHVFQLRPEAGGAFFIMHEIFRLAVFNFAA